MDTKNKEIPLGNTKGNAMDMKGLVAADTNNLVTADTVSQRAGRCGVVKRVTAETNIEVSLNLDEQTGVDIATGIGFRPYAYLIGQTWSLWFDCYGQRRYLY